MNSDSKPQKQENEEQLVSPLIAAVIVCAVVFGVGLCFLLLGMHNDENYSKGETGYAEKACLIPPDHPRQLVDFSLTDRTGRTVTRSELDGKILIVDFLLTNCSLTCPFVNGQMAKIQQLTANQPDIKLVSLTIDPRDDTPAVLKKYGERFGADPNRWLLLTGDKNVLYNLIASSFLAQDANGPYSYMPGNFSHTERIAVVDFHGHLHGYFDGLNQNTATAVLDEITKLRNQTL